MSYANQLRDAIDCIIQDIEQDIEKEGGVDEIIGDLESLETDLINVSNEDAVNLTEDLLAAYKSQKGWHYNYVIECLETELEDLKNS